MNVCVRACVRVRVRVFVCVCMCARARATVCVCVCVARLTVKLHVLQSFRQRAQSGLQPFVQLFGETTYDLSQTETVHYSPSATRVRDNGDQVVTLTIPP